jgi:DNA-binding response OmpR family regulator
MTGKKILVVDDDPKTVELVKLYLERDGYAVVVAYDGLSALRVFREELPHLVILDLMLPGIDGVEICRLLREESDVPIIMLTARTQDRDKMTGLDTGADDYVTKPFSPGELAARVRALFRRLPFERGPTEIKYGEFIMNIPKRDVHLKGARPGLRQGGAYRQGLRL